jgi:hypothetical protein
MANVASDENLESSYYSQGKDGDSSYYSQGRDTSYTVDGRDDSFGARDDSFSAQGRDSSNKSPHDRVRSFKGQGLDIGYSAWESSYSIDVPPSPEPQRQANHSRYEQDVPKGHRVLTPSKKYENTSSAVSDAGPNYSFNRSPATKVNNPYELHLQQVKKRSPERPHLENNRPATDFTQLSNIQPNVDSDGQSECHQS